MNLIDALQTLNLEELDKRVPEFAALKGRTQQEKHHPEGDAYVHTILCVEHAIEAHASAQELIAVFGHDFGKAITDDDNLPHHYGHESLGVPLVKAFCEREGLDEWTTRLATLACRYHLHVHRIEELRPITRKRMFDKIGNDRELIVSLGFVAECDDAGRGPAFRLKPYPQRAAFYQYAFEYFEI